MPSSSVENAPAKPERPITAALQGRILNSSEDVAGFFGIAHRTLLYTLYKAPPETRYRAFQIPKRSGGMRQIHAPTGLVRDWQFQLASVLKAAYEPHPSAHGFIPERSILSNARGHADQRLVLNIDLADFFPSVNFGRVRGLFMAPPFGMGPGAAAVMAQLCTHQNGLPQGAPTSPFISNFIAATLDRRLTRLAKENNVRYSRYADDITFSTNQQRLPVSIAHFESEGQNLRVRSGEALERSIAASGFSINEKKVRLQTRHQRQSVTGLNVNSMVNVRRTRVRRLRAMIYAWEKFGLHAAGMAHFAEHRGLSALPSDPGRAFRNVVYGELSFLKMVRGVESEIFLKFCAKLTTLDPNPSRFVRQMAFGESDFDVFISHASEDKEEIARPIFEACRALGLKVFLDEAHIGWGQSFTQKINTALGAARTVLAIVSPVSVTKDWPVTEVNAALAMEVSRQKKVVPLLVGRPDLSRLPLIATKDCVQWNGDAKAVAKRIAEAVKGDAPRRPEQPRSQAPAPPPAAARPGPWSAPAAPAIKPKRSFWSLVFGRRPKA